jgi:fibronectin-binding autotransporter adhesin
MAQTTNTWQGTSTNWSTAGSWSAGSPATNYGRLLWNGSGQTDSHNDLGTISQNRLHFEGSASYNLTGGQINFFDFSGLNPGVLNFGTGNISIANNLSFRRTDGSNFRALIATTSSGTLTLGGVVSFTNNVTNTSVYSEQTGGVITFTGSLVGSSSRSLNFGWNGADSAVANTRVVLAGDNTGFLGTLNARAGILTLAEGAQFSNTQLIRAHSGATINVTGNVSIGAIREGGFQNAGVVTIASGGTLRLIGNNLGQYFQNSITGDGNLTIASAGTTTNNFFGTQSIGGTLTLESGWLSSSGAMTAGAYALQSGTLAATLSAGAITVSSGTTTISGAGRLNSASSLTINSGQLTLGGSETVASLAGSGGTLALGANAFTTSGGASTSFSGVLTGSGALVKKGDGSLTLSGNSSSLTGGIFVDRGLLNFSGGSLGTGTLALGAESGDDVGESASLTISASGLTTSRNLEIRAGGARVVSFTSDSGSATLGGNIALSNSLAFNVAAGGALNFQGVVTPRAPGGAEGNVRLAVDGGGTFISTGNSTTTGANYQIRVGNATLIIGAGALTARTGTGGIGHGYDLGVDLNNIAVNATSSILASNGVTVASSVYVSTTNGSARVLGLSGSGQAEFSSQVDLSDAALTVTADASGNALFSGTINNFAGSTAANNAVIKTGAGTVTLAGNNTFGGGVTLSQGWLRMNHTNALGAGALTQSSGSVLQINTTGTITNNMAVYNVAFLQGATLSGNITVHNATFDVVDNETSTISGVVDGLGGVNKTGLGQLTLTGDNTYEGATTVNAGVLELASIGGAAAGATGSVFVAEGATLLISQSNQVNNSATVSLSGGTIQRASGVSEVFGDLNLTANSFLDFSGGTGGTIEFSGLDYTPSSFRVLQLLNFTQGNTLIIRNTLNWASEINSGFTFGGDGGFGGSSFSDGTFTITAIPEPSTYLVAAGLLVMLLWPVRRRLLKDAESIFVRRASARERLQTHSDTPDARA